MRTARTDMGARRVVPYLLRTGARRLDALLLTHPDADHIGGAASVLRALPVGAVLDPGMPDPSQLFLETLRTAGAEPAPWLAPTAGERLVLDGVELRFLHPRATLLDGPADPNDYSLVFRLAFGHFAALFLGDAPQSVEQRIAAELGGALEADVLKVGHHGSRTSSADELLEAVKPRLALISVGRDNRYGHPNAGVVARLVRHGARVVRTDEHGSIVIRAKRSGSIRLGVTR
jgi:competence protein ComEC